MMLEELRKKIKSAEIDAYVVSHGNRFLGQDVLPQEHKLKAVCGFSGSAGAFAITSDKAFLLVDGRYELQAQKEVDISKVQIINDSPRLKTLCDVLKAENIRKIGYDSWNYSVAEMEFIKRKYPDFELVDIGDLVDLQNEKTVEIFTRDEKYAGMSASQKVAIICGKMAQKNADYQLFCSADSVSWLLNIYSRDLPCSPIVRAYALVDKSGAITLFGDNLKTDLPHKNWAEFAFLLQNLSECTILYDPHSTPEKFKNLLNEKTLALKTEDICQNLKAVKNTAELQGMINCHVRDGVALSKFLCWLEENYQGKTELDIVQKLHEFRTGQPLFFSESFETIAGFAEHGAIVHYQPSSKSNKTLSAGNLLLLDSGGQYMDGTTDVTRTIVLGEANAKMKRDFTLVLKAHIALAKASFPLGTAGFKLDTLARAPLWAQGLDYKHGTGHGVACFGNVHEGPISISLNGSMAEFEENMVTSIEPGVYKENEYGIRIENLAYTKISANPNFLSFETLTLVPIDKHLVDDYLLDRGEREWLNNYHQKVYNRLAAYLTEKEEKWLKSACSPY